MTNLKTHREKHQEEIVKKGAKEMAERMKPKTDDEIFNYILNDIEVFPEVDASVFHLEIAIRKAITLAKEAKVEEVIKIIKDFQSKKKQITDKIMIQEELKEKLIEELKEKHIK